MYVSNGLNIRAVYVGTSAYALHKRICEHMKDVKDKKIDASAVSKHMLDCHMDVEPRMKAKLVANYNMTLKRYISEAILLDKIRRHNNVMNLRSEWGKLKLPRIRISRTGD